MEPATSSTVPAALISSTAALFTAILAGYVFLLAPAHERSFDSRYWGWLPEDQIVETLTEAWTW